jgi:ribosomal protein S18 acetylase RimI-like enzyme
VSEFPIVMTDKHHGSFLIRRYDPQDRPLLEAMYEDFEPKRAAQGLPPASADPLRRWLDRVLSGGQHLLVEVEGRVVGHVMLIPMDGGSVELANFLHQSIRNRGIGTRLNRMLVDFAREDGFRRIWLSVEPSNRAAVRSYEKAGFRKLPGSLWSPEIEMAVELQPA